MDILTWSATSVACQAIRENKTANKRQGNPLVIAGPLSQAAGRLEWAQRTLWSPTLSSLARAAFFSLTLAYVLDDTIQMMAKSFTEQRKTQPESVFVA